MAIFNESLYRTPVYDVTVYNQTEILAHKFFVEAPDMQKFLKIGRASCRERV